MKTTARTIRRVDPVWLNREIGKRLREQRTKAGLSLAQVGIGLGVSRSCVNNWELGRAQLNWNLTQLYNLALFYGVDVRRLTP